MFTEQNTNYAYSLDQIEEMNEELKNWCEAWEIPFDENEIVTSKESDYYKYLEQKVQQKMDEKLNQENTEAMRLSEE